MSVNSSSKPDPEVAALIARLAHDIDATIAALKLARECHFANVIEDNRADIEAVMPDVLAICVAIDGSSSQELVRRYRQLRALPI
jgi:hypothetical protein